MLFFCSRYQSFIQLTPRYQSVLLNRRPNSIAVGRPALILPWYGTKPSQSETFQLIHNQRRKRYRNVYASNSRTEMTRIMTSTDKNIPSQTSRVNPEDGTSNSSVKKFVVYAIAAMSEEVTLADLLPGTGVAFNTLTRHFKSNFGITPMHWLWVFRTVTAAAMLAETPTSNVTSIAFYCGFSSSSHFSRKFSSIFKSSPSQFRKIFQSKSMDRDIKKQVFCLQVKDKYQPALPLIIESISKFTTIGTIYNPGQ